MYWIKSLVFLAPFVEPSFTLGNRVFRTEGAGWAAAGSSVRWSTEHELPGADGFATKSQCVSSTACPPESACVAGLCVDCKCEPLKCLLSTEVCKSLKCDAYEGCYLHMDADYKSATVTVRPTCGKRDPCDKDTCSNRREHCQMYYCGDHPPTDHCGTRFWLYPCSNYTCPPNYDCEQNLAYCHGVACKADAACVDGTDCESCPPDRPICFLQEQQDPAFKGHLLKGICVHEDYLNGMVPT